MNNQHFSSTETPGLTPGKAQLLGRVRRAAARLAVTHQPGGEANLVLPDLARVSFLGDVNGRTLLYVGLGVCVLGLLFGLVIYKQLKNLPVHRAMREISELIYE